MKHNLEDVKGDALRRSAFDRTLGRIEPDDDVAGDAAFRISGFAGLDRP